MSVELEARIVDVLSDGYDDKEQEQQAINYVAQALAEGVTDDAYGANTLNIIEQLVTLVEDLLP